jgi:hypothetical protein
VWLAVVGDDAVDGASVGGDVVVGPEAMLRLAWAYIPSSRGPVAPTPTGRLNHSGCRGRLPTARGVRTGRGPTGLCPAQWRCGERLDTSMRQPLLGVVIALQRKTRDFRARRCGDDGPLRVASGSYRLSRSVGWSGPPQAIRRMPGAPLRPFQRREIGVV